MLDLSLIDELASLSGGLMIVIGSLAVVRLYWRNFVRLVQGYRDPADWFGHGIVVAFAVAAINALYWKGVYRVVRLAEAEQFVVAMIIVGPWFDLITIAAGTVWAVWCHLKSAHLALPINDRAETTPLWVWAYVNRNGCILWRSER